MQKYKVTVTIARSETREVIVEAEDEFKAASIGIDSALQGAGETVDEGTHDAVADMVEEV